NVLGDRNSDNQVTLADVGVVFDAGYVEFDLRLKQQTQTSLSFNAGLSSLGLKFKSNVAVQLMAGYQWDVGIGIDTQASGGFYLTAPGELAVAVSATMPGASAQANLGPLDLVATDSGSNLTATFHVALTPPSGQRFHVPDIASLASRVDAHVTGGAQLNL